MPPLTPLPLPLKLLWTFAQSTGVRALDGVGSACSLLWLWCMVCKGKLIGCFRSTNVDGTLRAAHLDCTRQAVRFPEHGKAWAPTLSSWRRSPASYPSCPRRHFSDRGPTTQPAYADGGPRTNFHEPSKSSENWNVCMILVIKEQSMFTNLSNGLETEKNSKSGSEAMG